MDDAIKLEAISALAHVKPSMELVSCSAISLSEVEGLSQFSLQGDSGDKAFLAACKTELGLSLPLKAGACLEKGEVSVLWLGPNEWLVVVNEETGADLFSRLDIALTECHALLIDVSHNRTILSLKGPQCWSVLNKGCSLDFHPLTWKRGQCATSLYGQCTVIFWQKSAAPEFYLLSRNSFADYLASSILSAMQEFSQ